MFCNNCGKNVNEGEEFCPNCGTPMMDGQQPNQFSGQQTGQQIYVTQPQQEIPPTPYGQDPRFDYTPISMWGYFGYQILFSIPCIGFILLLVFSFGGTRNINVRNFARSYFCYLIVMAVLVTAIMMMFGVGAGYGYSSYLSY